MRFDQRTISARIERRRLARDVPIKHMCDVLGIKKWDWSRKVNLDRSYFFLEEISVIADELEAPIGWPFIDEDLAEFVEVCLERRKKNPADK